MKIQKKHVLLLGVAIVLVTCIFFLIFAIKTMIIHVRSEDGLWDVYYMKDLTDQDFTWNGYAFYHGNDDFDTISERQFTPKDEWAIQGKGDLDLNIYEKIILMSQSKKNAYGICTLCPERPAGSVDIKWIANGKEKHVTLKLQK